MTTLTILANYEKKRLKAYGTVAAGEHVEVKVAGGKEWADEDGKALRLRVLFGPNLIGRFPIEAREDVITEVSGNETASTGGWETTGEDAVCELNLNTIPAAKHLRFGGTCLFILDDAENHTLYAMGEVEVMPWPKERGEDEPYNLDAYPDELAELKVLWGDYKEALDGSISNIQNSVNTLVSGMEPWKAQIEQRVNDATAGLETWKNAIYGEIESEVDDFREGILEDVNELISEANSGFDGRISVLEEWRDDAAADMETALGGKVDVVAGKGLSTNDFTNEDKAKLNALENSRYEIMQTLPATGADRIIYLVPRTESETGNVYDEYIWANGAFEKIGSTDIDLSDYYTKDEIDGKFDDLNYKAIAVSSLSVSPSSAEMGSTVTTATLTYALNKAAASATLDGTAQTLSGASGTIALTGLSITANKTWTLAVTDAGSSTNDPHTASKTVTMSFLNRAYWGAAAQPEEVNSAFVLGLGGSELTSTRARTKTVSAASGQYVWFAYPARLGAASFKVGGFDGGFARVATFNHTNASGYAESYYVYRSDNAGLGSTTVVVS